MFQTLRKKIQSLTETQQNIITVILVLFNIGIVIFWINFWVSLPKTTPTKTEQPSSAAGLFKSGDIGEISKEEAEQKEILSLPLVIFNTFGVISEIKTDRLIVQGSGSNFADKQPRSLTIIFTNSTETLTPGQKVKYQGLDGLKHLKPGMEIGIQGSENIRGKIEFRASIINIF